jgi:hypothetical protein
VAIAVAHFREDEISPLSPGATTEFTVAVYRNPVEHKIRLQQVLKWSEPNTRQREPAMQRIIHRPSPFLHSAGINNSDGARLP